MLFKLIHGLVAIPSITLTPMASRGHSHRYYIPPVRTETYLHSFLPSAIKLWNNLPQSLTEISNIDNLELQLEHYLYPLPLV